MANLSNHAENAILNHTTGKAAWTMPTTLYLALFSADPTDAVGAGELSGGGYARIALTFATAASGTTSNDTQEDFAAAATDWTQATHWVLFDALTGGNGIWHGAWGTPVTVLTGQQFRVRVGDIVLSMD